MNRGFLSGIAAYLAIVVIVVLGIDHPINGQSDAQLIRVGLYSPIVVASWLLAGSAIASALSARRRGVIRWLDWPPEWDWTVAAWAVTKSAFFSVLWCHGVGWPPPEWVLNLTLTLFAIAHTLFTAQWLGSGPRWKEQSS